MTTTYRAQPDGIPIIDKSPNAVLDYPFNWAAAAPVGPWLDLAAGETIVSKTIVVTTGITVQSSPLTPPGAGTVVTVWLVGGTAGTVYTVTCQVVTSAGRTDERSIKVNVVKR